MILIIYLTYTSKQIISTREFLIITMLKILQKAVSKKDFDLFFSSICCGWELKSPQWSWKWKNKYSNSSDDQDLDLTL